MLKKSLVLTILVLLSGGLPAMSHDMHHIEVTEASPASSESAAELSRLPDVSLLPEGTRQVSPTVSGMGSHWAKPADLPFGPIYCVHANKIICAEFMIAKDDFAAGKQWPNLPILKGLPAVDHLSVDFSPRGHEGFDVPHYDIHLYFVSTGLRATVLGDY